MRLKKLTMTGVGPLVISAALAICIAILASVVKSDEGQPKEVLLPTGKTITPIAARGAILQDLNPGHSMAPDVRASGAASVAVSPDGKMLATLTTGFNVFFGPDGKTKPDLSTEYLFLFDLSGPHPRQVQVLPIHATFQGLSWAPSSDRIFASGGMDDAVVEFTRNDSKFVAGRTFKLGHKAWVGADWGQPFMQACAGCKSFVSGVSVSPDGTRLLVANLMNDSVSLIDIARGGLVAEQDLRPGIIDPTRHGQPGGSYPRAVAWSSATRAYIASERDREIIALDIDHDKIRVIGRQPVSGQPTAVLTNRSGSRLYVALDTTNRIAIFETGRDKLIESLDVAAPESVYTNTRMLGGANTNALALTPDESTLLVSNGGENAIAVVRLSERARGQVSRDRKSANRDNDKEERGSDRSAVVGLVPTGWYPGGVATSKDGRTWYVVNGKSPTGPNVSWCKQVDPAKGTCIPEKFAGYYASRTKNGVNVLLAENQQVEQLEKAGLLSFPAPSALELARLTKQAAHNNGFDRPDKTATDERLFSFLRGHVKHVIYILKENRSYDQVLGDLGVGNGDPRLTMFPERISPNHHAIARNFVDLDNTLVSAEGSYQGFSWTESAQTTDYDERAEQPAYASRGPNDGDYGNNRLISMGHATSKERHAEDRFAPTDPDILPGSRDPYAPDGPDGMEGKGYLWDLALKKGLTVRNWGLAPISTAWTPETLVGPDVRDPFTQGLQVFWTSKSSLMPYSDPYYRPLIPMFPDYWRVKEWKREFAKFCEAKKAPNLMVMWLGNDHFGYFDKAQDGVNTPETQMADNDYALGSIVEAVAKSPFANDTLIVAIEDDTWDGGDHVDAHRTLAFFAGPYVRQRAVVSTRYTTVNMVKTVEEILGIGPIGLNDALAAPMSDVFDPNAKTWWYQAIVPNVLRSTQLPLPPAEHATIEYPRHSAGYWAKAMANQDFSGVDRIQPVTFNRALWRGLQGNRPYPDGGGSMKEPQVPSDLR